MLVAIEDDHESFEGHVIVALAAAEETLVEVCTHLSVATVESTNEDMGEDAAGQLAHCSEAGIFGCGLHMGNQLDGLVLADRDLLLVQEDQGAAPGKVAGDGVDAVAVAGVGAGGGAVKGRDVDVGVEAVWEENVGVPELDFDGWRRTRRSFVG